MYKPRGYITTLSDEKGRKKVTDLLRDVPERVYLVGRLDYDSEGLLLLTNDGDLTYALTHPRHQVPKTYLARVKGVPEPAKLGTNGQRLGAGGRSHCPRQGQNAGKQGRQCAAGNYHS